MSMHVMLLLLLLLTMMMMEQRLQGLQQLAADQMQDFQSLNLHVQPGHSPTLAQHLSKSKKYTGR